MSILVKFSMLLCSLSTPWLVSFRSQRTCQYWAHGHVVVPCVLWCNQKLRRKTFYLLNLPSPWAAVIICMLDKVLKLHLWVMTASRAGIPRKVTQYSRVWALMGSQKSGLFDASTRPRVTETWGRTPLKMNELENEKVNMIYAETQREEAHWNDEEHLLNSFVRCDIHQMNAIHLHRSSPVYCLSICEWQGSRHRLCAYNFICHTVGWHTYSNILSSRIPGRQVAERWKWDETTSARELFSLLRGYFWSLVIWKWTACLLPACQGSQTRRQCQRLAASHPEQ